ncbi:HNH endonuclease [Burkholderia gladioli]|uniref:HNH endonuclease n=2 Tax=Burkholderia gladioli TaxID=28095 RepID=UPI003F7A3C09
MRVRLCWRKKTPADEKVTAAQMSARLVEGSFEKTMTWIVERDLSKQVSYCLLFQHVDERVTHAALIPTAALGEIWSQQRATSAALIANGRAGRVKSNHATNGGSPTLWLSDTRTPDVGQIPGVLWNWPGVEDLTAISPAQAGHILAADVDDTIEDLAHPEYAALGADGGARYEANRSFVKRDPGVRKEILRRAGGACERISCGIRAGYDGFLDVHHIFGVQNSDRVWTCVALCPNCHRSAHFSPERDAINAELSAFAAGFAPSEAGGIE